MCDVEPPPGKDMGAEDWKSFVGVYGNTMDSLVDTRCKVLSYIIEDGF
jgi:hypothetical protein